MLWTFDVVKLAGRPTLIQAKRCISRKKFKMRIEREESRIVFQGDLSYDQVHRGDRNSLVAEHPAQLTCPLKVLFSCFEVLNGTEEIIQRDLFFLRFCPSDKLRCDQTRVGRVAVSKKVFELIGYNFIGAPEKRISDGRVHEHPLIAHGAPSPSHR